MMNRRIVLGCLVGLLVGVCAASVAGYFFIRNFEVYEPEDVAITVSAPASAPPGEPFALDVRVENEALDSQLLDSIDISQTYLDGFTVQGAEPAFSDQFRIPVVGYQSFTYGVSIPGNGAQLVTLELVGDVEGTFAGEVDVCINDGATCQTFAVETAVSTAPGR